jgi:hydroxymethylglutaryl-CoA reductase
MKNANNWSRLPGFFDLNPVERRERLVSLPISLGIDDFFDADLGLCLEDADRMSENVVARFSLPFSIAANFIIDNEPVLIPMVTEEPSIVAASSKMAKIVAQSGGFITNISPALIKGQIQFYNLADVDKAQSRFYEHKAALLHYAQAQCPGMAKRGGGVIDLSIRLLPSRIGPMLVVEAVIDVQDAMGANIVNSVLETLAPKVHDVIEGSLGLIILSNLCDMRLAHAQCVIPFKALATDEALDNGRDVALKMLSAHIFAESDIYRAATHNKGILNGIDAVAIASGNDTRAIEAGAHAYAALKGYGPLTALDVDEQQGVIHARLTMPLAIGVVGGITKFHAGVKLAHKILGPWAQSGKKLSSVMVSAGLSQCLAAILAMCQEGIQKGHMKLHNKKLLARTH